MLICFIPTGSITTLFGGGDQGDTLENVTIKVTDGTIGTLYSGANQANITGDVTTEIDNGTITDLFGGNNVSGIIGGEVSVIINNGTFIKKFIIPDISISVSTLFISITLYTLLFAWCKFFYTFLHFFNII